MINSINDENIVTKIVDGPIGSSDCKCGISGCKCSISNIIGCKCGVSGCTGENYINNSIGPLFATVKEEITLGVSKLNLEKYLSFIDDILVKQIVIILTNNSAAVQDVVNMIDLILADGKIDLNDAPLLLGLIKKIVALRTKDLPNLSNITISQYLDVLKLVFTILAKEGILKIEKIDEFIGDTTNIIGLIKKGEQVAESVPCLAGCFGLVKSKIK